MANDDLADKLRRDAIESARRVARAFSWLADEMEASPKRLTPRATDLLGMPALSELFDACAKLRLLRDLDREGK